MVDVLTDDEGLREWKALMDEIGAVNETDDESLAGRSL